jgi:hypothetical protein
LTEFQISGKRQPMGRPPKNDHTKSMPLRFPPGLRERMEAVLRPGEDRTTFIRELIVAEVERRERQIAGEGELGVEGDGG